MLSPVFLVCIRLICHIWGFNMKKAVISTLLASAALAGSPAHAAVTLFNDNGHYYEYVAANVSWDDALASAAGAAPIAGFESYLVTVTSAAEDAFIRTLIPSGTSDIWLAGTDRDVEGTFTWAAGPEAGQTFTYTNWNSGEPNNAGNEDYVHIGFGPNWNDIPAGFGSQGYIVEYSQIASAAPEPATWALIILGFGMVGSALRRRKQAVRVTYAA